MVEAHARGPIGLDLREGKVPDSVEIVLECVPDVASLGMLQVAGADIPVPVRAGRLSRAGEGWVARLDGWSICRYLRTGEAGTDLVFRLTATDGTVTRAHARLVIVVKE